MRHEGVVLELRESPDVVLAFGRIGPDSKSFPGERHVDVVELATAAGKHGLRNHRRHLGEIGGVDCRGRWRWFGGAREQCDGGDDEDRHRPSARDHRRETSGDHRCHVGGRFSMNADIPSLASALWKWWSDSERIRANAAVRTAGSAVASRSSCFVALTASGATKADRRAQVIDDSRDVVADVGDESDAAGVLGVERLTGEQRAGEVRRGDPAEDRHRDDRRDDADADLAERERHGAVDDDEVARCNQADAARPHRSGHGGNRRHVGIHQSFERADDGSGVRRSARPFLEIGAGAEHRWRVGQHDRANVAGGHRLPRRRRARRAGQRRAGATGRCGWRANPA